MPNQPGSISIATTGKIDRLLFRETDNRMLVIFRIIFGFLMSLHCFMGLFTGQVYRNFISPPFTFNYIGLDFLQPLPGQGMYVYFSIMGLAASMVMIGYRYRISSIVLAAMWTIIYLMQKVDYNNHYYLMVLICWIMVFVPANKRWSADVKSGRSIKHYTCQQWVPVLFISLIGIMYLFAGISKFDGDWISGRFLGIMFSRYRNHQYLGSLYGSMEFAQLISYAGLLLDLLIVPALLWDKTRKAALIISIGFHLFNSYTFHIGIFPYLGIALNLFFFMPLTCSSSDQTYSMDVQHPAGQRPVNSHHKLIMAGMTAFLIIQLILPLRHYLFPGNVFWTDEGYRMSWKMMGRTKSGWVKFKITDMQGVLIEYVDPSKELSAAQCMWLAGSPDMIWQYSQRLKKRYQMKGNPTVQVYAIGEVSMNRRKPQPLIDSTVNLAAKAWEPFHHAEWIMPFREN